MRKNIFIPLLLFIFAATLSAQIPEKYQGHWDWECLNAPDGFQNGTFKINADTIVIYYDYGDSYISDSINFESDTLMFSYEMGVRVDCYVFMDSSSVKSYGYWNGGEGPVTLTRKEDELHKAAIVFIQPTLAGFDQPNDYFLNRSLISVSRTSSLEGAGGAAGASASKITTYTV